ncbi:hypothetical protein GW17_00001023 [Ensete ventricosum]|nr:hypothetical protein GW17_00001023 [Ensete ventricosum]
MASHTSLEIVDVIHVERVSADVPGGTQLHLLQQTPHILLHIFRFHDLLQRTEHFAPQSAPPKTPSVSVRRSLPILRDARRVKPEEVTDGDGRRRRLHKPSSAGHCRTLLLRAGDGPNPNRFRHLQKKDAKKSESPYFSSNQKILKSQWRSMYAIAKTKGGEAKKKKMESFRESRSKQTEEKMKRTKQKEKGERSERCSAGAHTEREREREREREVGKRTRKKPHVRPLTGRRGCVSFPDHAPGPCAGAVEPPVLDLIRSSTIGRLTLRFGVSGTRCAPVRTRVGSGVTGTARADTRTCTTGPTSR